MPIPKVDSPLERILAFQIKAEGLTELVCEHIFDASGRRKFRFDFAWVDYKIAVEVEGGSWIGGRHSHGSGFENDCIKYNLANEQGWHVYRYTRSMIESGEAIAQIKRVLRMAEIRTAPGGPMPPAKIILGDGPHDETIIDKRKFNFRKWDKFHK